MEIPENQPSISLEYVLRVLRRRGWIIVLLLVLATAAALGASKAETKKYSATASLLFRASNVAQSASGIAPTNQNDPQGQRVTNLTLVQLADVVAQRTAASLHAGLTPQQIKEAVVANPKGQSDVVSLTATDRSPLLAARIANTFAKNFIQQQRQRGQANVQAAIALVGEQFAQLTRAQQISPQGQALLDRVESLKILKATTNSTEMVQAATVPEFPSSPRVARNTVLGGVFGLLIGVGLAFLIERLDRRLREPQDVEESFGVPLLGLIPHGSAGGVLLETDGGFATLDLEPFRLLRAHLRYFNVDRELRTVLVTSAVPAEGKTAVSRSLATAAAIMGTKTLLIEADLRRPNLGKTFQLEHSVGLAGALVTPGSLETAIHQIDVAERTNSDAGGRRLDVLPAGAVPPNPAELLESQAMQGVLSWAAEHYDLVVVDTAPVTVVPDAIPLMKLVDGVIVVSRLGRSTRDSSQRLRQRLDSLGAPVLGVVVNDVRSRGAAGYGYGYGYGYTEYAAGGTDTSAIKRAALSTSKIGRSSVDDN